MALFRQPQSGQDLQDQVAQLYTETREDVYRYLLTLGVPYTLPARFLAPAALDRRQLSVAVATLTLLAA